MNAIADLIRATRVVDLGPLPAPHLAPGATVYQAVQSLSRGRRGAVIAVENDLPVGIFTERDVLYRLQGDLLRPGEVQKKTPLRDVMSKPVVCIPRTTTLLEAIETMDRLQHRHLVVTSSTGAIKGLLTTNDLVQYLTDQFPQMTLNLPPRLHQVYQRRGGA